MNGKKQIPDILGGKYLRKAHPPPKGIISNLQNSPTIPRESNQMVTMTDKCMIKNNVNIFINKFATGVSLRVLNLFHAPFSIIYLIQFWRWNNHNIWQFWGIQTIGPPVPRFEFCSKYYVRGSSSVIQEFLLVVVVYNACIHSKEMDIGRVKVTRLRSMLFSLLIYTTYYQIAIDKSMLS